MCNTAVYSWRDDALSKSGRSIAPVRLGPYQVLRQLGRGGLGVVYEAIDERLGRIVALKVLERANDADLMRVLGEARAVATFDHPDIVRIHEVGLAGEHWFVAAEYVEGEPLSRRIEREGPLDPHEAAEVARRLAGALEYAHERQILHRHLTSANVLFDGDTPRLTDVGITRSDSSRAPLPEGDPDERSDVYALGATLCEMLTGETYERERGVDLKGSDPDLQAICRHCLEEDPERRYPDASALAADLDRYLAGERPTAPSGRLRRVTSWARENTWLVPVAATALLLVALIAG